MKRNTQNQTQTMNFHIHLPPPLWMVQVNLIVTITSLFTSHTSFYRIPYGPWSNCKPNSYRIGVAIHPPSLAIFTRYFYLKTNNTNY